MSSWPVDVVAHWWRESMDYGWDGPGHKILDVWGCIERGYGSCGDAAASLLAACVAQGREGELCIEILPGTSTRSIYKHVRVIVDGWLWLDPYSATRPKGLPEYCTTRVRL